MVLIGLISFIFYSISLTFWAGAGLTFYFGVLGLIYSLIGECLVMLTFSFIAGVGFKSTILGVIGLTNSMILPYLLTWIDW